VKTEKQRTSYNLQNLSRGELLAIYEGVTLLDDAIGNSLAAQISNHLAGLYPEIRKGATPGITLGDCPRCPRNIPGKPYQFISTQSLEDAIAHGNLAKINAREFHRSH